MYILRHAPYLDVKQAISIFIRVLLSLIAALTLFVILRHFQWNAWIETVLMLFVFFSMIHFTRILSLRDTIGFVKRLRGNQALEA